ncbi:hypothetical protein A2U01_0062509, partial [Trifolium medium]|nr:hypothetical protein [Trifolium medium]
MVKNENFVMDRNGKEGSQPSGEE